MHLSHSTTRLFGLKFAMDDIPDTPPPPHHANDSASLFCNPWLPKSLLASKQWQWPLAFAKEMRLEEGVRSVKVVKPEFSLYGPDEVEEDGGREDDDDKVKATWLGHAVSSHDFYSC